MVSKKRLNADHTVEVLLDKDSNNNLIPESDSSKSHGSEGRKSPETGVIRDISNETTPIPSPVCAASSTFTADLGLNTDIQAVM
jgi:hypothetical protein